MRVPFEESMLQSHPCRMKGDQVREPESRQSSRASAEKRRGVARYGELTPRVTIAEAHQRIVDNACAAYETLCAYGHLCGKTAAR